MIVIKQILKKEDKVIEKDFKQISSYKLNEYIPKDIDDIVVNELINELKEPMAELNNMQFRQLEFIKSDVNYLINNNIKEERRVLKTFDILLDLVYWFGKEMEDIYFKLVEYYRKINVDVANDYEKLYKKIIEEGWVESVLLYQIDTNLYQRQVKNVQGYLDELQEKRIEENVKGLYLYFWYCKS